MPPLEAWEKVFISDETFLESIHGQMGCITCHGGASGVEDKEAAHEGIVREPDSLEKCGPCHAETVTADQGSLHSNLTGYLTAGHQFKEIPPMNLTCTGCHGSRINDEYKGKNEGVRADVHWIKGGMPCFDCHSADEMHGVTGEFDHRYDGPPTPSCQDADCHATVAAGDGIAYHTEFHLEAVSCQVCHSTT